MLYTYTKLKMNKSLNYITYQTFPAQTANSLQTISNIRYLVKKGVKVSLYFPLREKGVIQILKNCKIIISLLNHLIHLALSMVTHMEKLSFYQNYGCMLVT